MSKVLVIEDDKALRELLQIVLRGAGHMVVAAGNGKEGIHLLLKDARDLDVLISDLGLPDMAAADVVSVARTANSHVKVLIISGVPEHMQSIDIPKPFGFLSKPFNTAELLQFVNGA